MSDELHRVQVMPNNIYVTYFITDIHRVCLCLHYFTGRYICHLLDMPNEVIILICLLVPKDSTFCSLKSTCRRLHHMMNDDVIWRQPCLRIRSGLKSVLVRRVFACAAAQLTTLDVRHCLSVTDAFLRYTAANCPNIAHLDVGHCPLVSDAGLVALGTRVHALCSLCVRGTRFVTSEGLGAVLAAHRSTIAGLDISHCVGLERNAYKLSYLPDLCAGLTSLRFGWDEALPSMVPLWEMRVSQFAACCRRLTRLDVSGSPVRDFCSAASAIAAHCGLLQALDVSSSAVSDAAAAALAERLPHLETLAVAQSPALSPVGLRAIGVGLARLRHLDVSGCLRVTDDAVVDLLRRLPLLRDLLLRACLRVTDAAFSDTPAGCPALAYLDVGGTRVSRALLARLRRPPATLVVAADGCPFPDDVTGVWPAIPRQTLDSGVVGE